MDAGLMWAVVGSVAGVLAVVLAGWQVRLQLLERREKRRRGPDAGKAPVAEAGGLPVAVPLGLLPGEVRGRDALLAELRRKLGRGRRDRGGTWVLAGMGGLGKSTVALAVARMARERGWRVWWVTASDAASLTGGMLEVLRQLGAPESVVLQVREGAPTAAERVWGFLNGEHAAGRRWLLVFDNADAPAVLAAHGAASPADHAGWLRPDPSGMVIVTSRVKEPGVWGPGVRLRELGPLDDDTAARVLADLAPGIKDRGGAQARELGHRLGGLPLALHLAGSYLASPFARWRTFAEYCNALDSTGLGEALADLDRPTAQARVTIQRTWDLSLDALAADARPQARPLLLVLSCYAPVTPIPRMLLRSGPLARVLAPDSDGAGSSGGRGKEDLERLLRDGLSGLAMVGLIDLSDTGSPVAGEAVTVHPVVADVNRSRLLGAAHADLPAISDAAVQLLQAASGQLDSDRPLDWPTWRILAPHVLVLVDWLAAHLDTTTLTGLLGLSAATADALRRSGSPAAAENLARLSVLAAGRLGAFHPVVLTARHQLLWAVGEQDRNREAEQLCRSLLADQQQVLGNEHPDTLATRHGLVWIAEYQGRYAEAEQLCRALLTDQQRIIGAEHPDTLNTQNILARLIGLQGRYREAEQLIRRVLADRQRVLGEDHLDTLVTRHNLAWITGLAGRNAEAEQMLRGLLADRQRILGDRHPATLTTHRRLARVTLAQGRAAEAEQILRPLLSDLEEIQGDEHPATLTARDVLARAIGAQGRASEAERLARKVVADWQRIQGEEPRELLARNTLARMIAQQGRNAEAEVMFRRNLSDEQRVLGDTHPDTQSTRASLAENLAKQGQYHEAEDLLRTAVMNREQMLGDEHPDTVIARQELTQIITKQGKTRSG
jgi:tetratricopeptide (TPR) repeat protein